MGVGRTPCRQPGLAGYRNVGLWLPPFLSPAFFHTQVASHHQQIQPAPAPASPPPSTPSPPSSPAGGHVTSDQCNSSDSTMSSHINNHNLPTILEDEIGKSNKENAANEQSQQQNVEEYERASAIAARKEEA